jgi:hypothetical protein
MDDYTDAQTAALDAAQHLLAAARAAPPGSRAARDAAATAGACLEFVLTWRRPPCSCGTTKKNRP